MPADMAGTGRRQREWRVAAFAITLLVVVVLAAALYGMTLSPVSTAMPQATVPAATPAAPALPPALAPNSIDRMPAADERSGNLQAAFTALWQSERRIDRARALSIWNTCVPVFLGAGNQAASLQRAIAGLPADPRYDAQRSAYADLFGRCKQFYGDSNAELSARTSQLRRAGTNGDAVTSARLAADAAARGDVANGRALADRALATADPHELFELGGMASKLLPADATPQQRATAMVQDLVPPLAACELGLDCQMNSLLAVRLCAFEGLCNGAVQDRLRSKYAPDIDPGQLASEVTRLVAILRAGASNDRGSAPRAAQPYFAP